MQLEGVAGEKRQESRGLCCLFSDLSFHGFAGAFTFVLEFSERKVCDFTHVLC